MYTLKTIGIELKIYSYNLFTIHRSDLKQLLNKII